MKKKSINPYILVLLSFVLVIFVGSFLLVMPWAQKSGSWGWANYLDSLFTCVSATCVTGLCTYSGGLAGELTLGGQIIVLVLIQLGGLGFITVLAFFLTLFKSKLQFKDRYFLSQAVNSNKVGDVVKFVRKIILISFIAEIIGVLLGLPVFFVMYPDNIGKAVYTSIFMSISAFNNAGFDCLGSTSLISNIGIMASLPSWATNYLYIYLMILIVTGGISFLTLIDVFSFKKPNQWRSFTKICLSATGFLLCAGFLWFLGFEIFKGEGHMTPLDAIFQSVTCRTAGFASYDQNNLTLASKIFSCFLMFVGGSPLSTAGGIKTTTFFMVFLCIFRYFKRQPVSAFKRAYSTKMVTKSLALLVTALAITIICSILISSFETSSIAFENILFETFSAFGTTGLSTGITPSLNVGSKIVLILLMFAGRLGPMTFFQVFQVDMDKQVSNHYQLINEDLLIG